METKIIEKYNKIILDENNLYKNLIFCNLKEINDMNYLLFEKIIEIKNYIKKDTKKEKLDINLMNNIEKIKSYINYTQLDINKSINLFIILYDIGKKLILYKQLDIEY